MRGATNGTTITNGYGVLVDTNMDAADTITNWNGIRVRAPAGTGTITNKYGMIIEDGAGNVGIGTNAPWLKLSVIADDGVAAGEHSIAEFADRTYGGDKFGVALGYYGDGTVRTAAVMRAVNNSPLAINPDGGNVGIGTTTPAANLDVAGSIKFGGLTVSRVTTCKKQTLSGGANAGEVSTNYCYYDWKAEDCTNGLPQGSCTSFIKKASQDGRDEDWESMDPGEYSNWIDRTFVTGGMLWWNMNGCGGAIKIASVYMCDQ